MHTRKPLFRYRSLLQWIVLGLMIVLTRAECVPALTGTAAPAMDKIEPELLDLLAVKGTGDFIIRFAEQADLRSAANGMGWQERGQFVVKALAGVARRSQTQAQAYLDDLGLRYQTFIAGNELYVWAGDRTAVERMAALPEVAYIRATRTYPLNPIAPAQRRDPQFLGERTGSQAITDWGIADAKADQFWSALGVQGDGIVVANIDTGVDWDHSALINQFKCPGDPANPACWSDPSNICGAGGACDNNGHGTHTMGTMVADDDPTLRYIAGMAPNARWIACKGCEGNSCSDLALNACADWILSPAGDPANRPHIVNSSWGSDGADPWYLDKVNAWRAAGIFPAFSAGNGYTCNNLSSPGDYQESFASAAHASSRTIAGFSSKGPSAYGDSPYTKPNISAPGATIYSTWPGNTWNTMSGTSMASPHAAGAVALLWSCNPRLIGQLDLTFQALLSTADPPPAGNCGAPSNGQGNYTYGYGYLNILQAGTAYCNITDLGALHGYVYDAGSGEPISGASVSPSSVLQGDRFVMATTDPTGYYTMSLIPGTYQVTASKIDYEPQIVAGVQIVTDTVTRQDFSLTFEGHWLPGPSACFDLTDLDAEYYPATGKIYLLGGRQGSSTSGNIYRIDPFTGACADTGADMPTPISSYTISLIDDGTSSLLCTFGGRSASGQATLDVQCYDPIANVVTVTAQLPPAYAGYLPGGQAVVDNQVYLFGGHRSEAAPYQLARTDRYNPLTNTFSQIGDLSQARGYLSTAVVDGKIYAFGGGVYDGFDLIAQTQAEVMAEPAGAGTWDDAGVADLPAASAEGRAYGFNSDSTYGLAGQIVLTGGGRYPGETAEVLAYDVASNTYDITFPDLINARRGHAGVLIPICSEQPDDRLPALWVFGGRRGSDYPPYMPTEYHPLSCPPLIRTYVPYSFHDG
jgi:hypothetical protein